MKNSTYFVLGLNIISIYIAFALVPASNRDIVDSTGLMRNFGGFDKGTDFYIHNPVFRAKLGLIVFISGSMTRGILS